MKQKITKQNAIRCFKVFNSDWTCRGFQFEVGKTYKHEGEVEICSSGFHACLQAVDCFSYYTFDSDNKVAEVLIWGQTDEKGDDSKVCGEHIKIVRALDWQEVLTLVNTGKNNTGFKNSGYSNSGDRNSGYSNSGDRNSGDSNSGDRNSGDSNSGYRNSGDSNSGDSNSGYSNSGYSNSGYSNSGYGNKANRSSGIFCTEFEDVIITEEYVGKKLGVICFNKPSGARFGDILHPSFYNYDLCVWVSADEMADSEKENNPKYETTEGYLKTLSFFEMWKTGWNADNDENKLRFFNLPNFDLEIFKEITGLDVSEDYKRLKN